MSDKYYRGLRNILNDTKYKLQLASMTLKINENKNDISGIKSDISGINNFSDKINDNSSNISSNKGLIDTNTSDISTNLEKITALQTSNVKAFYNLDQIFIYDIESRNQTVNKDNHFHIFEKEITYNFTKNSYLEIILKFLTNVASYILIGYFQILCNFYDQDNNLFYTISLSTAMGSINKLSTIKSVFIVPINENMSKIKIDFFITPLETQQHRSTTFSIQDINSNKIYIKYYQKTNEISIKDIENSLNAINNISSDISNNSNEINYIKSNITKSYLKNIYNILFYNEEKQINSGKIFYEKIFVIDSIQDDFIELNLKMLIKYEDISQKKFVRTIYEILDENNNSLYFSQINNNDYQYFSNKLSINENIFYNFTKNIKKIKFRISFVKTAIQNIKISYINDNNYRFILMHYGN